MRGFSILVVFARIFTAVADAPSCSGDECDIAESVSLLQTSVQIDHGTSAQDSSTNAHEEVHLHENDMANFEAATREKIMHDMSCKSYLSTDAQRSHEVLRRLGHLPERHTCLNEHRNHHVVKLLQKADQSGSMAWLVILGAYGALVAVSVFYMYRAILYKPKTMDHLIPKDSQEKWRPEMEAWKAGFFSWFLISWVTPWIHRWGLPPTNSTTHTKIKTTDIGYMGTAEDESQYNVDKCEMLWKKHCSKELPALQSFNPSVTWNVLLFIGAFCGWPKVCFLFFTSVAYMSLLYLVPPLAIRWVLNCFAELQLKRSRGELGPHDGLLIPVVMTIFWFSLLGFMQIVFNTTNFLVNERINIRLQGGLAAMVYRKANRLPASVTSYDLRDERERAIEEEYGASRIGVGGYSLVQLISSDVNGNLVGILFLLSRLIVLFPVTIILLYLLISRLQCAVFMAFLAVGLTFFVFRYIMMSQWIVMRGVQSMGGQRVNRVTEAMFGIKIIKCYAWESRCEQWMLEARRAELRFLRLYFGWTGFGYAVGICFPRVVICSVLIAYSLMYGGIKAVDIFFLVQLLNAFQGASGMLLGMLPNLMMAAPSMGRIRKFMNMKEAAISDVKRNTECNWATIWPLPRPGELAKGKLLLQGDWAWTDEGQPALQGLNIEAHRGEVIGIVGKVASGKSTLIHALMGELCPVGDSRLEIPEKIAYHCQVPYIQETTLRDNVLFCHPYDEQRYNRAIYCSGLRQDLSILPGGDAVPIGSRGITLSGGQRARVSIARAIYSFGSDLVLLDDPFASVDQPTGVHIMDNVLFGDIMKDRICVVAMQPNKKVLKRFTKLIVVENGKIAAQGEPKKVFKSEAFNRLMVSIEHAQMVSDAVDLVEDSDKSREGTPDAQAQKSPHGSPQPLLNNKEKMKIGIGEEETEGRIDVPTLMWFLRQAGLVRFFFCLFFFQVMAGTNLMVDATMAHWTNAEVHREVEYANIHKISTVNDVGAKDARLDCTVYILQSILWLFCSSVLFHASFWCGSNGSLAISTNIFDLIIRRLMRAPIDRFYDRTPVGRILNRCSSDVGALDFRMYTQASSTIGQIMVWIVPMGYIHYVMPLIFSFVMIPWYVLLFMIMRRFINVVVPLRYLANITRSDVNTFISEIEISKTTIRAYQVSHHFAIQQSVHIDNVLKAQFASDCSTRWCVNRILILYCYFSTAIVIAGLIIPNIISMGIVSMGVVSAVHIIMSMDQVVSDLSAAQFEFISMNRIFEYTQLPQERPHSLPGDNKLVEQVYQIPDRAALGKLEARKNKDTGLLQIVRVDSGKETLMLEQIEKEVGVEAFAFASKDAMEWFKSAGEVMLGKSDHDKFGEEVDVKDELDITHRLISVDGCYADCAAMAEDFCHGSTKSINIRFAPSWILGGAHIKIQDLVAGYADIPVDVLRGITLEILPRSKVAICGTTGCGKSTTILCLLRILEPRSGTIHINHVNTQDIGLRALRRSAGLVPQDPIIFSGTVRSNLDPFFEYPESMVWKALEAVQLKEYVSAHGLGLYMPLKPEGGNLSFGQRQLLCVARMILRQPGLLLLDECTSAIDPRTQELVQKAIRESFPNSTLIVIAHRLETILDFDNIVVMQKGQIVETGGVKDLATRPNGLFARMLSAGREVAHTPSPEGDYRC